MRYPQINIIKLTLRFYKSLDSTFFYFWTPQFSVWTPHFGWSTLKLYYVTNYRVDAQSQLEVWKQNDNIGLTVAQKTARNFSMN